MEVDVGLDIFAMHNGMCSYYKDQKEKENEKENRLAYCGVEVTTDRQELTTKSPRLGK